MLSWEMRRVLSTPVGSGLTCAPVGHWLHFAIWYNKKKILDLGAPSTQPKHNTGPWEVKEDSVLLTTSSTVCWSVVNMPANTVHTWQPTWSTQIWQPSLNINWSVDVPSIPTVWTRFFTVPLSPKLICSYGAWGFVKNEIGASCLVGTRNILESKGSQLHWSK